MNYENKHRIESLAKAAIPDGRIKARAIAQAKRAMRDLGIRRALLVVNSMRTSNILDIITVELD